MVFWALLAGAVASSVARHASIPENRPSTTLSSNEDAISAGMAARTETERARLARTELLCGALRTVLFLRHPACAPTEQLMHSGCSYELFGK